MDDIDNIKAADTKMTFDNCHDLFEQNAFTNGEPNACKLHDAFGGNDGPHHNCIGCNFASGSQLVLRFLKRHKDLDDVEQDVTIYILLLYLIVEKAEIIIDYLKYPSHLKSKNFQIFILIKRWANFIKHPKAFLLSHHSIYNYEDSNITYEFTPTLVIDSTFVSKYYKGVSDKIKQEELNNELYDRVSNKKDILVMFPNLLLLTVQFCYEYDFFVDMILSNETYRSELNNRATLKNFFTKKESVIVEETE
ncbi:MAG: hypothetical protein IPG55_18300 [Saprospiraceae bacterium]|nr:hypothetical protein [Candidatus Defluviibacterium haderslevense]MBK7242830.1 hypothetical protein [Candidatus Defluviibacterium haderslevense]